MFEFLFKYPRDVFARSDLTFAADWPLWLLPILSLIALLVVSWFLFVRRRAAPPLQLIAIGVLQLAMIAVVLWMLRLPTLQTEQLRAGENTLAVVLDASASMGYGIERTRLDDGRQLLEAAASDDRGLDLAIQRYVFADGVRRVDSFAAAQAQGESSPIAEAVTDVLREARLGPLAAIVVASDGADTTGGLSAEELAAIAGFGVPVHTIGVGRSSMPEDLEIEDVQVPKRVLPDSTVSARVSIRHDDAAEAQVKIYDNDDLLASVPVTLEPESGSTTAWIDFALDDAGPHQLEFSVDSREGEQELRNNRRSRLIDVEDDNYRILYYEGEPRWEYKFMRRAIHGDDDLGLVTLLRVSPNKFYRQGLDSAEELADGFPTQAEELYAYDALIIGSVEAASFTLPQQVMIRDFVSERGGTLLMLAGPNGLGAGGWSQSPVADALPTRLPGADDDTFFRIHAPVSLTAQGNDSQMLRLTADETANVESWRSLPGVANYQLTGPLKPAAIALLTADTESGALPLLITQPFGRGRSFVLATGGTWRWQMSLPVDDQRHETFWRQLLRTLVASAPPNTSLSASAGAEGIELRAEFRDREFAPLADVGVSAIIAREGGESWTVPLSPSVEDAAVYTADFEPGESGIYYLEAVAQRDDEPLETARASLSYETGQAEHFGIRSNPSLLARLSAATGGEHFAGGDIGALPDLLRYSSAGITEIQSRSIWDMPALFLILLLLKSCEWLLRRRWGTI